MMNRKVINKENFSDIADALVDVQVDNNIIGRIYTHDDEDSILIRIGKLLLTLCSKDEFLEELNEQEIVEGGVFIFDDTPLKVFHVEWESIIDEIEFWERDELSYQWEED